MSNLCEPRTLVRTRSGRIILPPWDLIDPANTNYPYTEAELDDLYAECMRRRRHWRILNYTRLVVLLIFFYLSFISLPILLQRF